MTYRERRENSIDILKGTAIVLMVLGHSGISEEITRFIYLFHMAVFVIAAGYCYNERYSRGGIIEFAQRRIQTLYLPYIGYMLMLVLLHNVFIKWNIYTDSVLFLDGKYGNEYGLESIYTVSNLIRESIKCFFLLGHEQLFGAAWFIRVLFYMSLLWCAIDNCLCRFCKNKLNLARVFVSLLLLIFGNMLINRNILNFSNIPTILTAYILFAIGFFMKKLLHKQETDSSIGRYIIALISGFVILIMIFSTGININMAVYDNVFLYLIASVAGWAMLYSFGKVLLYIKAKWIISSLCYLGRNTMPIVLFHFIAFKFVTLIQIVVYDLPMMRLASFPIYKGDSGWWVLYALAGVGMPICLTSIWRVLIDRLKRRDKERGYQ